MTENEKLFLKKLESIYDALYKRIDDIIKEKNPCKVQITGSGKSLCVTCAYSRKTKMPWWNETFNNDLCCGGCKFLGKNGCTANKPIMCRSWLCSTSHEKSINFGKVKKQLEDLTLKYKGWFDYCFRGDKKMTINETLENCLVYEYGDGRKIRKLMKRFKVNPSEKLKFEYNS